MLTTIFDSVFQRETQNEKKRKIERVEISVSKSRMKNRILNLIENDDFVCRVSIIVCEIREIEIDNRISDVIAAKMHVKIDHVDFNWIRFQLKMS